jgi:glycosyltransferase involved in cell wall biosynthesis
MERFDVTTVILTRHRPELLSRAIGSLEMQIGVSIKLLILVDDCPDTMKFLERRKSASGSVGSIRFINIPRKATDFTSPERVAKLRNIGLQLVRTKWCNFLDDDNIFEPDHMLTLASTASESGANVVHSWRTIWNSNGRAYLIEDKHPWVRNPQLSRRLFKLYYNAGIYTKGSNIIKDQVVPFRRSLSMVDTSEWLFETKFIRKIGFNTNYSAKDKELSWTEDAKLLDAIVLTGILVPSTRKPTLRYFLGGYSNSA